MNGEEGLKLQLLCALKHIRTLKARTDDGESYKTGDMTRVANTIGIVVEDVGPNEDFVLVYMAKKIVAPKISGSGTNFVPGENVYYDSQAHKVTTSSSGNVLCGKALESASDSASEVLIELIVFA